MSDETSVPLSHYLEHDGCAVRFHCRSCEASHDVPVAKVVERLKARGLGDERTGICEVGEMADQPCKRCGAKRWATRPGFPLR